MGKNHNKKRNEQDRIYGSKPGESTVDISIKMGVARDVAEIIDKIVLLNEAEGIEHSHDNPLIKSIVSSIKPQEKKINPDGESDDKSKNNDKSKINSSGSSDEKVLISSKDFEVEEKIEIWIISLKEIFESGTDFDF